jgi:hypothetical protein
VVADPTRRVFSCRPKSRLRSAGVNISFTNAIDLFESLDDAERRAAICFAVGREVEIGAEELNESLRRAVVVRAVGGDPSREPAPDEDAVVRLADELETPERSEQLQEGLARLARAAEGRPATVHAVSALAAEPQLAWRTFCAALLADEIGSDL